MSSLQYTMPRVHVTEHSFRVPLDWSNPDGAESVTVFARELVSDAHRDEPRPYLLYLEGGPGGKAPRPARPQGWLAEALTKFRVVLLDQRGTGRSDRIDGKRMQAFTSGDTAAAYLRHFRADSIVRDAEYLRTRVLRSEPWTTLGQSFGGFITLSYLSFASEGLRECLIAGGVPSIAPNADGVYQRTFPRTAEKNRLFHSRYPHQAAQIGRIADRLEADPVALPNGDTLSVRRLQSLGLELGMIEGPERLHWLFDEAFTHDEGTCFSDFFLHEVMTRTGFISNPLFAVLQEAIYGHGQPVAPWSAERERAKHPEFDDACRPLLLTGEMIFPWMFDEIRSLRPFATAMDALHNTSNWPELYDVEQLSRNAVPVAAAVYYDDMFVDAELQLGTLSQVGNSRPWVTNEYEHDGISDPRVFRRLRSMATNSGE